MSEDHRGEELPLGPYRVLDLTDERGFLCGKILADLGPDVIQVEPPEGSPARSIEPFYQDERDPEKPLSWWAYAANKRGITLNLSTPEGREPEGRGWASQERFATLSGRKAEEDELDQKLGDWTKNWDPRELMDTLQQVGVPAGMLNNSKDLFEDPQLTHRGHFRFLDHPELGVYATDRSEMDRIQDSGGSRTAGATDRAAHAGGASGHDRLLRGGVPVDGGGRRPGVGPP